MRCANKNRSYVNINPFLRINESDLRMDDRNILTRDIPAAIREANDIRPRRKPKPLRFVLHEYRNQL